MNNKKKLNVGKDAVVIGNVNGNIGNGSVVIGPTDSNGNTIINQPMAVGKNAKTGPGSIAIGANAGAGSDVFLLLNQLKDILEKNGKSSKDVINLIIELQKPNPDKTMVQKLWGIIKSAAAINDAIGLIGKIGSLLL